MLEQLNDFADSQRLELTLAVIIQFIILFLYQRDSFKIKRADASPEVTGR